jgi:glycerol-3-phosphate acyltransferase PlsX
VSSLRLLQGPHGGGEERRGDHLTKIRIAVDAMGSEGAPGIEVDGVLSAVTASGLDVVLVGDEPRLRQALEAAGPAAPLGRIQIRHAPDTVGMDEAPAIAFRHKKASSLRVCFDLAKAGEVDAVVSAGNSGALLAGALIVLGRISAVERPAIATTFPTETGECVLLDMGANVDLKASVLAQFAVLGATYARLHHKKPRPRVGVLSNGTEEQKGTLVTREACKLLGRAPIGGPTAEFDFLGYVEGRDIFKGAADVIVTDGFTGNVLLKGCEGLVEWIGEAVKEEVLRGSLFEKLGAWLMRPALRRFKHRSDYAETGGAPLIGIDGVVIVCHGGSDARAIKNAVVTAGEYAKIDLRSEIARSMALHSYLWQDAENAVAEEK